MEPGQRRWPHRGPLTRLAVWLTVWLAVTAVTLPLVLFITPIRIPMEGDVLGIELFDGGEMPGSGPPPGWYSGPLYDADIPTHDLPLGTYCAYFDRDWGLIFQFGDSGSGTACRWKRPTRSIHEHPLALMLLWRVESGRLDAARLTRLLGPPSRRGKRENGEEWIYVHPGWSGDFIFALDSQGKVHQLNFGYL